MAEERWLTASVKCESCHYEQDAIWKSGTYRIQCVSCRRFAIWAPMQGIRVPQPAAEFPESPDPGVEYRLSEFDRCMLRTNRINPEG